MSTRRVLMLTAMSGVLAAGCAADPMPAAEAITRPLVACAPTGADADGDGLDDGEESCLLDAHAPVLYLPRSFDWTSPANVDWYLGRTALRFHHGGGCGDCTVLSGGVTQESLTAQRHTTMSGLFSWPSCKHKSGTIAATDGPWNEDHHFFLQPMDDATHAGAADPADWRVYGHAYRNSVGGVDLQYWFFYPYNDSLGSINHEGDWESVTVRRAADGDVSGVFFCQHGDCTDFRPAAEVGFHAGTHPEVWVARGSHASYASLATCNASSREVTKPACETAAAHRWFTWTNGLGADAGLQGAGVVNVGERGKPLAGQRFVDYYSRWGELGELSFTSGPRTPSFQPSWFLP